MKSALLLILAVLLPSLIFAEDYFRVCYVTNWSQYRKGIAKYVIKDHYISGLCTHLLFAFGKVEEKSNGDYELTNVDPSDLTVGYPQTQKWKEVDPNLKTMLSVGGYTAGSKIFSKMVRTEAARRSFITQSVIYLQKYGFDGLDIDWEFPGKREGSSPLDKPNLTKLCKEMKEEYAKHGLLVSAAVMADSHGIGKSYDVAGLFKHLDFVNLMTYDLNGPWQATARHHTDTNPVLTSYTESMDNTIEKYIELGAVPEKIVLGLASYGKVFELENQCSWKMNSFLSGKYGTKGEFTRESGLLSYYEICRMKVDGRVCTKKSQAYAPYASKGKDFINYDDQESIQLKVNRLVKRKGKKHLKGVMIWALDFDDFNDVCSTGKYPLWQAAIDALDGKDKTYDTCTNKEKSCVAPDTSQYNTGKYVRACFITNWAQYRTGFAKFDMGQHYEPGLCTHLFYAFAKVEEKDGDFNLVPVESNDLSYGYIQTNALKRRDQNLKTILSVGGFNHKMDVFSNMIKTSTNRNNLITNAAKFITSQGFDGLDLYFSWQWPNSKEGSSKDDKENFGKLIKEMKAAFSKSNLLLTATVVFPEFYDLTELSKNVDFINAVQTFNLHQPRDDQTGHPTRLNGTTSVSTVIDSLIKGGVDPGKLNLGISTGGQTSQLSKSCDWDLGSSTNEKGGVAGKFTNGSGTLAYYEICSLAWKNHVCTKWSPVKAPYGATATDFVAYDDENSLAEKIKGIVMPKNLRGVFFWTLDFDDFSGRYCSKGRYPLVRSTIKALQGKSEDTGCLKRLTCGDAPKGVKPAFESNKYYRICYFTNWAQYRTNEAKFSIGKNYEVGLCTHIFYAFAKVVGKDGKYKLAPYEWNDVTTEYKKVTDLTKVDHKLKVLLSVGGSSHKSKGFTEMAKTEESRKYFITEAWKFITLHKFSGLDIDWEYPGRHGGNPEDKENFVKLLKEMRKTFDFLSLMLTVTVDGKTQGMDTSYDVSEIANTVDFINVNTYNYVDAKDNYIAHHIDSRGVVNIVPNTPSGTVDAWIAKGAPANKLVLGLSGWARTQKLTGLCEHKLGSKTKGEGGRAGYFTKSAGFLAYYETCRSLWESHTCAGLSAVQAPYGSTKRDFISYDDTESIALKLKEIMIKKQLRGFSFWSLDLDDFWDSCKTGTYPLLKAAKEVATGFEDVKNTCKNLESSCFATTTTTSSTTTIAPKQPKTEVTTTKIPTTTTTTEEETTTPMTTTMTEPTTTTTTERETTTTTEGETQPPRDTTPTTSTTTQTTSTTPKKPVVTFPPLPDADNTYSRVCFFTDTARERDGIASFDILQRYELDLCTHLVYTDGQIVQLGFGNIIELRVPGFKAILHKLKTQDRRVKILLGVGKDKVTIASLKVLMNKPDVRKRFIQHAAIFLNEYGFDGLNILWDPPTTMPSQLKYRFTSLCNELKSHFQSRQLLITASLSAQIIKIDHAYEVDKISRSLDMINIMTYNYYDIKNPFAAHHTDARESTSLHDHKIDNTITHLINRGVIARKLVLGLSTFAKTWDLKNPVRFWNLGSSTFLGGGQRGKFTQTRGMLAYYEVCRRNFKNHVCTATSEVKAPYGSDGETFIGYDDPISIKYKIETFMLAYGMKGFMFSDIDYDDFGNLCKQGHFPLLKAARDAARNIQRNTYNCTEVRTTLPPPTTNDFKNAVTLRPWTTKDTSASAVQCSYNLFIYYIVVFSSVLKITLF